MKNKIFVVHYCKTLITESNTTKIDAGIVTRGFETKNEANNHVKILKYELIEKFKSEGRTICEIYVDETDHGVYISDGINHFEYCVLEVTF